MLPLLVGQRVLDGLLERHRLSLGPGRLEGFLAKGIAGDSESRVAVGTEVLEQVRPTVAFILRGRGV